MRIMCPGEFAAACQFSAVADVAHAEATDMASGEARRKMENDRGKAARSLVRCIGNLAKWDALYNEDENFAKNFTDETEIWYANAVRVKVGSLSDKSWLPKKETLIFSDPAKYSFFFQETWIDPRERRQVCVMDSLYYCFPSANGAPAGQDEVNALTYDELRQKALDGECEIVWTRGEADKRVASGCVVRHVMRERKGMCGGVIYHSDWVDGKRAPYGSWQIHT